MVGSVGNPRSVDDPDNLSGSWVNQHGPLIHNRVAVGIAKAHARRDWSKACISRCWLTHDHRFGCSDRGAPLRRDIGTNPPCLLGAQGPRPQHQQLPNSRAHQGSDNGPARCPEGESCASIGLACTQWNSHKNKRQNRLHKGSRHEDCLLSDKNIYMKLDLFLS
jgi:hypothetical protein